MRLRRARHEKEDPTWEVQGEVRGQLHAYAPEAARLLPPLRDQLAVFSRPRDQADELPAELASTISSLDEAHFAVVEEEVVWPEPRWAERLPVLGWLFGRTVPDPEMKALVEEMARKAHEDEGSHLIDQARLLLSLDKQHADGLYAIPTTTGQVWIYLVEGAPSKLRGGHLLRSLPSGIDWQIHSQREPHAGTRWVAFGLLANEVEGVDLEFPNASVAAQMGSNAFFFEGEGDSSALLAFVLQLADGGSTRLPTEAT
jgi:hypothetical protein